LGCRKDQEEGQVQHQEKTLEEAKAKGLEVNGLSEETRVLTVNLSRVYWGRRSNRAARAVRYLKEWIKRRLRAEQVLIEEGLNKLIWSRGIEKPPRKVKVKVVIEEKRETTTESGKKQVVPVRVRVGLVETEGTRQA